MPLSPHWYCSDYRGNNQHEYHTSQKLQESHLVQIIFLALVFNLPIFGVFVYNAFSYMYL